ncbi:MAG: hypothetical protein AB8G26_19980 [Ilumatobacter sp.]
MTAPTPHPQRFDDTRVARARTSTHRRRASVLAVLVASLVSIPLVASAAPEADGGSPTDTIEAPSLDPAPPTTLLPTPAPTEPPTENEPSTGTDSEPEGAPADVVDTSTPATTTSVPVPDPPTAEPVPNELRAILASIRHLESRNDYTIPPNAGNASGAYQFIESTWANYRGYQHAYLAPPAIQDERAVKDVRQFLEEFGGDISMIPVMWYYPRAARETVWMDLVPKPENGNKLTVRQYQARWLSIYASFSGELITPRPLGLAASSTTNDPDPTPPPPPPPAVTDGLAPESLAFPVLGPSRVALPTCEPPSSSDREDSNEDDSDDDEEPSEDDSEPSTTVGGPTRDDLVDAGLCGVVDSVIVFGVKLQPILSMSDGIVTSVADRPGSEEPIEVTITNEFGISFIYSGFNDDSPGTDDGAATPHHRLTPLASVGRTVRAGQIIGFMGDSDPLPTTIRGNVPTAGVEELDVDEIAPHIRVSIRSLGGQPIDAFRTVSDALFEHSCRVMLGPWSMPVLAPPLPSVVIETTDDDEEIDSEWVISRRGQVGATGWAAMINPNEACGWAPAEQFGADGAGSTERLDHWSQSYDLPTPVWVALAMQDDLTSPAPFHR